MATGLNERFVLAEDAALKRKLEGLKVSWPRETDVDVWFRWPNKEIREIEWPFIVIDLVDITKADHREHQGGPVPLTYAPYGYNPTEGGPEDNWVPMAEDWPTPYDLVYTVTVATKDPRHERQLLGQFLGRLDLVPHRWGFLEIPEDGSVRRLETVGVDTLTRRNSANDIEHLRVYTVRVESELFTGWVEDVLRPGILRMSLKDRVTGFEEEVPFDGEIIINF